MKIIARTILSCNVLATNTTVVCAAMAVNPEGLQEQGLPFKWKEEHRIK